MEKLIISVAPTGSIATRAQTPYLPLTPREIAAEVYACHQAGAAVAHIHVRDALGNSSLDPDIFAETVRLIRERCDIIINLTTSGGVNRSDEERLRPLSLKPEMGSLDAGSVNFGGIVFVNHPDFLELLATEFQNQGVKPEIEIFDAGMINNALILARKGLLAPPLHFQFVLGVRGALPATPKNLLFLVDGIPPGSTWSVVGIGQDQLPMTTLALVMGGHVRVGMEDNIYYEKGVLAKSNVQFVERMVKLAGLLGREVATPASARRILALRD